MSYKSTTAAPSGAVDFTALVEGHVARLSQLVRKAEQVAEALLERMLTKVQRREEVYPGELVQLCKGLHALARCGTELHRIVEANSSERPLTLSAAEIAQLEARLRPAAAGQ